MERIPVAGPWITEKEVAYVADAARTGWFENANSYALRFERAFADRLGVRHAIVLPSCTSAIHLALIALGVGPGDEVIVPDITWIASAAPITYVGATTVFADIDAGSWCLSAESFRANITPRTKAVIPVDLYGNVPDLAAIRRIAHEHKVAVIEDAAEAVGAVHEGRPAGSFGDAGVFSFHGSKTLTTGEGGMLVTDRDDIRERVLFLRDHGRVPGDKTFRCSEIAYKYKMSNLQAALGLAQLERLDELMERKRAIFGWYVRELEGEPGVSLNVTKDGTQNAYWMVTAILDQALGLTKQAVMSKLAEERIDTRPFFDPLSSLDAYKSHSAAAGASARNAVSYSIAPRGLNLPSALTLTEPQAHFVCDALRRTLRRA